MKTKKKQTVPASKKAQVSFTGHCSQCDSLSVQIVEVFIWPDGDTETQCRHCEELEQIELMENLREYE